MFKLDNINETKELKQSQIAVAYAMRNIKYKFISNCIRNKMSPDKILEELKSIGLCGDSEKESNLRMYISALMYLKWDENNEEWIKTNEIEYLSWVDKMHENGTWDNIPIRLSENDSKTLFDDMKTILGNLIVITKSITKLTDDIDRMAAIIYEGVKPNEKAEK